MNALLAKSTPHFTPRRARAASARSPMAAHAAQVARLKSKSGCACGGSCPRCQAKSPVQARPATPGGASGGSRGGLALSTPGDRFEHEADRVADTVMRSPSGLGAARVAQRSNVAVNRSAAMGNAAATNSFSGNTHSAVAHGTRGGGQPLDSAARAFLEPRFGRDFASVRIHTGRAAAESASALGAVAYTVGRDIVFAPGHYAPHTEHGRWLLAHELTHTVQQGHDASAPVGRFAAPEIHTGAAGLIQRVTCAGKSKNNCYGNCTHPTSGNPGNCMWSGTIANGCVCYEKPRLSPAKEILYDLVMSALIAAAIVVSLLAIAAIIACLMGPCEVAALVAALGFAGAMIVIGIINAASGDDASAGGEMAGGAAPSDSAPI